LAPPAVRVTDSPAQTVVELAESVGAVGAGFTVIVNVCGMPEQFPIFGVTVTVEVIAEAVLAAIKVMFPEPELLFNPIPVSVFVQLYVTAEFVAKFVVTVAPLHTVIFDTLTAGVGFTVTVRVSVLVQEQTLAGAVSVKIYRTSIGESVVLVSFSVIVPVWLASTPLLPSEVILAVGNAARDHSNVVPLIKLVAV
jgi:hypothetical protein